MIPEIGIRSSKAILRHTKDISLCVQCGKCKASCPTYQDSSKELLGARGRAFLLRKFEQGLLSPSTKLYESIFSCILCEACTNSCPLQIDIPSNIYKIRKTLRNFNKKTLLLNYLSRIFFKSHSNTYRILKILKILSEIAKTVDFYPLSYIKERIANLDNAPFRDKNFLYKVSNPKGRLALFTGCIINCFHPHLAKSLVRLLNILRYDVIVPIGEVCCGAPLLELGLEEEALKNAQKNIKIYKDLNVESIVSLCPTCIHFLRNVYNNYLGQSLINSFEISEFLSKDSSGFYDLIYHKDLQKTSNNPMIFHDPCHLKYSLNITKEPRDLLKALRIDLKEPKNNSCCGSGGIFSFFYGELSSSILDRTLNYYKETETIVTSCPNCLIQLGSKSSNQKVFHLIDVLVDTLEEKKEG
ncbi:MAG: (Fe-S)-binding protein [Thermodesulfovibrionales bacterium]|nr:(Fe-S)-binding protein [Thermodesulfovibrionales bacterium]